MSEICFKIIQGKRDEIRLAKTLSLLFKFSMLLNS